MDNLLDTTLRTCRQCGEAKPLTQYRQYYGGRTGYYRVCKSCERINSRVKYLEKKGQSKSVTEAEELNKIYRLYEAQRACGLQPPRRESGRKVSVADDLDRLIEQFTAQANVNTALPEHLDTDTIPPEIKRWLTAELVEEPDYYLDEVYEDLKREYRPLLRIDKTSMLPVYDDTHKAALDAVLDRFNDYEDSYYDN